MSAFDKVIGYETIKSELLQLCDMIQNPMLYSKLGAKLPKGLLLYGNPGLGKSLMAKCFIEESGLTAYTIRRNSNNNDFITTITGTFEKAKGESPVIVFLDDIDKFANEDNEHKDAEEYVAVQSGIDDVSDHNIFVIATANDLEKLPKSLIRPGRFDRQIHVHNPSPDDAVLIIRHYLADKMLSASVNMDDLSKMISYRSCAELETILNEAAITAAYRRKESIEMEDLVDSVLRREYDSPDIFSDSSDQDLRKAAIHETGHLVVCESLIPGSVGLASVRLSGRESQRGFINHCKKLKKESDDILILLAGKAALDLYYADGASNGCSSDIRRAKCIIARSICENGERGFGFVDASVYDDYLVDPGSELMLSRNETVIQSELERYTTMAKTILIKNRAFLEKIAAALIEKATLLYSDISEIKRSVGFVESLQ